MPQPHASTVYIPMKILIFPRPLTLSLDRTAGIGSRTLNELQTRLIEPDYHYAITYLSLLDPGTTNTYHGSTFVLKNHLIPSVAELDMYVPGIRSGFCFSAQNNECTFGITVIVNSSRSPMYDDALTSVLPWFCSASACRLDLDGVQLS